MKEYKKMEEKNQYANGYQVLITNIVWNKDTTGQYHIKYDKYDKLPKQFTLDLPESVFNQAKKNVFKDVIESFVYNFLTRKYNHEVNNCQIWLPLEK